MKAERAIELVNRVCCYDEMNIVTLEERAAIIELLMGITKRETQTGEEIDRAIKLLKNHWKFNDYQLMSHEIKGIINLLKQVRRPEEEISNEQFENAINFLEEEVNYMDYVAAHYPNGVLEAPLFEERRKAAITLLKQCSILYKKGE